MYRVYPLRQRERKGLSSLPSAIRRRVKGTTFAHDCLLHLSHVDTDPRLLEKQEQQQPTYVALSYINR